MRPVVDPDFEEQRPTLQRLAYRMLGSLTDADDVLQEAYLRWSRDERGNVEHPRAYLSALVTRLCIDRRRTIDARKETYIGPWLPEPIVEKAAPEAQLEAAEAVSLALLVVLESLSPTERAAYLLRQVFDYEYAEIARILGQSEANCRQLVSRAEKRIAERRPRFESTPEETSQITEAFLHSCVTGDLAGLTQLLATDAIMYSDGGGKVLAARAPVYGADRVARFFIGLMKKAPPGLEFRRVSVNGGPGLMVVHAGEILHVLTLDIFDGKIAHCYIIRNPDKLPRLES